MPEMTLWLRQASSGDASALNAVFEHVYSDLRRIAAVRIAAFKSSPTLTPTVLVHEAYIRLIGSERLELNDRRHFYACAARAMRFILVDHARRSKAEKRGGGLSNVTWTDDLGLPSFPVENVLDLDRALEDLSSINSRAREVVDLRFFAGLTAQETADLLQLSLRTVHREWEKARAFLHVQLASQ